MKLAISNIGWSNEQDNIVYDLMQKYGYEGLEIAPTRIFATNPYEDLEAAKEWSRQLADKNGLCVPSMQSIWYGREERLFGTEEERATLVNYTKMAINFAAAIGCKNLVFGCPRNRNVQEGMDTSGANSFFKEIGDYAFACGTVIGMEANPTIYNTNYVNDTYSALELIRQVNSAGFKLNLDVGTIIQNQELLDILVENVTYINHVHISEPGLKPIEERSLHAELKDILSGNNYNGFISIEMGKQDEMSVLEEKMSYVKKVFG